MGCLIGKTPKTLCTVKYQHVPKLLPLGLGGCHGSCSRGWAGFSSSNPSLKKGPQSSPEL
eukprot:2587267-Amphidinium_carterae.1